jgi:fructose-specific component phosphotransferase system IIB-like protein
MRHRIPLVGAITTIPSAHFHVVRQAITDTITNPIWVRYRTVGIIEVAEDANIAITAGDTITTFPSALCCVVNAFTITITNQFRFRIRYRTVGIIEVAVTAKIASIAGYAITTFPSALRCVVNAFTITITNCPRLLVSCSTIGIMESAVRAEIAIITGDTITTFPSALFCVVRPEITNTITNRKFISREFQGRIRYYRTTWIIEGAVEAKIPRSTAIATIPSALFRVVKSTITNTITNKFWFRYGTIGVMEGAVGAEIAIIADHAITTVPSAPRRVVKEITITITNNFRKRYSTIGIIEVAVEAEIASTAVDAIAAVPSALLCIVRLAITHTITNIFWKRHRTIRIVEVAVEAEMAIIAGDTITTFPPTLFCVVIVITVTITNQKSIILIIHRRY